MPPPPPTGYRRTGVAVNRATRPGVPPIRVQSPSLLTRDLEPLFSFLAARFFRGVRRRARRRKTGFRIDRLAPFAFRREKQRPEPAPLGEIIRYRSRKFRHVEAGQNLGWCAGGPQVLRGEACEREQLRHLDRWHRQAQSGERILDDMRERGLEILPRRRLFAAPKVPHPLVAPRQHPGDQPLDLGQIIVEMLQEPHDRRTHFLVRLEPRDQLARGFAVQHFGILHDRRRRAEAREHGHLPRQRGAERIDGAHAQPLGACDHVPPLGLIARERRLRQFPGRGLVRQSPGADPWPSRGPRERDCAFRWRPCV